MASSLPDFSPTMMMDALYSSLGVLLIGVVAAGVLYGCTLVQMWNYFTHYYSDRWHLKLIVASTFVADTVNQVLIMHSAYTYLTTNWALSEEPRRVVWGLLLQSIFNGYTTFCVQCFLAMRIYKLSNRGLVRTASAMVLVVAQFTMILVSAGRFIYVHTIAQVAPSRPVSMPINMNTLQGDFISSLFLCILLLRSRTDFRKSDMIINRLIMFSLKTGLLPSLCALASLICYSVLPSGLYYMAFYFCIARLYCNSLLAILNARKKLRSGSGDSSMLGTTSKDIPSNSSIEVDTMHEHNHDEQDSASLNGDAVNPEVV